MSNALPRAARPFLTFVSLLRLNGFAIAPEQTTSFLSAISLLGPRGRLGDAGGAHHHDAGLALGVGIADPVIDAAAP